MRTRLTERSDVNRCPNLTPHPAMYFVYILKNKARKEVYCGYTNNLERRLEEHSRRHPWNLVYYEAYKAESDARNRERQLKLHAQALTALKGRIKESLK